MLHKESDEAKRQMARNSDIPVETSEKEVQAKSPEGDEAKKEEADEETISPVGRKEAKVVNQFNQTERAAQTYNNPTRVSEFKLIE